MPAPHENSLRCELANNLNHQEANNWLGNKYEERDEYTPLQRSLSLDRGIEIFNYLRKIGVGMSAASVASTWTLYSDDMFGSVEDVAASPRVRSRRASSVLEAMLETKPGDEGRKLLRNVCMRELEPSGAVQSGVRFNRSISFDRIKLDVVKSERTRDRINNFDLRKEILLKENFKSSEDLSEFKQKLLRRASESCTTETPDLALTLLRDSYLGLDSLNGDMIRKESSKDSMQAARMPMAVPIVVVTDADEKSVAKINNSSSCVDCDCRLCSESSDSTRLLSSVSNKFSRLITFSDKVKKWRDENNNLTESEMYTCVVRVLKLLFGLWLRHCGHKHPDTQT